MAKENKKEVSFVEGPIFQSLIRFALPVLGALILQAAYGAVDLLVVGWFGDASSISAVGTGIILLVIDASRGRRREVEHELLNLNRLEIDMINTIPLAFLNKRTWVFGATGEILCDIGMHILIIQWCKD